MTNQNEGYLVHHGIGGMKWGHRNGPPYPLSGSAHSSSERAAGTKGWSADAKKESKSAKTNSSDSSNKGLTDSQKETLKKTVTAGAIVAGASLATIGLYKTGNLSKLEEVGKVAAFNAGKGLAEGVAKGIYKGSERVGETVMAGATMLAMVEVADLATNGAATNKMIKAYNDFTKKDSRVNTEDLKKIRSK